MATKQSILIALRASLDCFAEFIIGPAKPDPLARNGGIDYFFGATFSTGPPASRQAVKPPPR